MAETEQIMPPSQPPPCGERSFFRCPRCGKGKLYRGLLTVAEACSECGLPLRSHEQGDGPASVVILIIGGLAAIGASAVEVIYEPPYWLHAALWIPFIIIGSLACLRWVKAALIAVQYRLSTRS